MWKSEFKPNSPEEMKTGETQNNNKKKHCNYYQSLGNASVNLKDSFLKIKHKCLEIKIIITIGYLIKEMETRSKKSPKKNRGLEK